MARYGPDQIAAVPAKNVKRSLAALPVAALRISAEIETALSEVGIERIGQLLDLPHDELAARFGSELLRRLDQASGERQEHIEAIQPAAPRQVTQAFAGPVARLEIIRTVVRELLMALMAKLHGEQSGIRHLCLTFQRVDAESTSLTLSLTYPSRDVDHLWSLVQPKLERVPLGYGVEEITLHATRTARVIDEQMYLWPEELSAKRTDQTRAVGELVDQLKDRLGPRAVKQVKAVESYVPEQAFIQHVVQSIGSPHADRAARSAEVAIRLVNRPSQLFETPEPARVLALVPDGPPARFQWRGLECAVRTSLGPERVVAPWWAGHRSSSDAVRDYYEVEDTHGRWLWLFRVTATGRWFVHGLWA